MDFDLRGETQANNVLAYIGYAGGVGSGTINVKDGALLTMSTSKVEASMFIGVFGGSKGTLNVDNATADLGGGALLGYASGATGTINVTNGGHLLSYELDVGSSGTGTVTLDATSTADVGGIFITQGTVDNAGTIEAAVVKISNSDSNMFTNTGTTSIYQALTLEGDGAKLIGSGTVNLVNQATLTNNGGVLDIGTLNIGTSASANLSSMGGSIMIDEIRIAFENDLHGDVATASVMTDEGAAANLANTKWFFTLSDDVAKDIETNGTTRYLTNMMEVTSSAYYSKATDTWYTAVTDEEGSGTCVGHLNVENTMEARLANTEGSVTEGDELSATQNAAQVVNDTAESRTADLFVKVETTAERTQNGMNGHVVIASSDGSTEYEVNNAYVSNTLTLKKTDLLAEGDVNVQSTVNLENAEIRSAGSVDAQGATFNMKNAGISCLGMENGTIMDSTIKGTGTLTKLDIVGSTLVAGNSPGKLTLNDDSVKNGTMGFYVGTETAEALAAGDVEITLDDAVTSGFVLGNGTVLSGDITLNLWTDETTLAYSGGRIFDKVGQSLQLFIAGEGVDLAAALAGANFTLGDTFGAATTWAWDTSELKTKGKVKVVVPEPATATLSLLALAGLCARRRRKNA